MSAGGREQAGLLASLLACWLCLQGALASPSGISHHGYGRKLFGGYKMTPKPCQGRPSSPGAKDGGTGICMFNYECSRRSGQVLGTCTDSFLFGACCKLPPDTSFMPEIDAPVEDPNNVPMASQQDDLTLDFYPNRNPPSLLPMVSDLTLDLKPNPNPPSLLPTGSSSAEPIETSIIDDLFLNAAMHRPPTEETYSSADTVLIHQNGSVVNEPYTLEDLLYNKPSGYVKPGSTEGTPTSRKPEISTFSYVTGPGGVVISSTGNDRFGITSRVPSYSTSAEGEPATTKTVSSTGNPSNSPWDHIVQSNFIPSDTYEKSSSVKPYVTDSTTYYSPTTRYTKPTFFTSTTKWHSQTTKLPSFRPKPSSTTPIPANFVKVTTTKKPAKPTKPSWKPPSTQASSNFVQVPLVSASNNHTQATVTASVEDIEVATNAASISHILSLLNDSTPAVIDREPVPIPEPEAHPNPHNTTSGISTWVSIDGQPLSKPPLPELFQDQDSPTAPSKEQYTVAASNLVTHATFFTGKRPTTVSYFTNIPTRKPPLTTSTVNIHGPAFTVKPKDPVFSTPQYDPPPLPTTALYSAQTNTFPSSYNHPTDPTVFYNPTSETEYYTDTTFHYNPTPDTTFHYNPTPDTTFHYNPSPDPTFHYPPTPPPPIRDHYEAPASPASSQYNPSTASPPSFAHSEPPTSLRPPPLKPQTAPPAPTVIVLGPYDPVSTSSHPIRKPVVSTTESSDLGHTGLVYTQVQSNNAHGGHVTIITKKPARPATSSTVTKRTPITVSSSSVTTPSPATDILQSVSAYPTHNEHRPPSENDFVAFPPVRDPNLNVTSHPGYSTTQDDEEYTEYPYTTPHLDDVNLDNKVHGFVNKIVQSLSGNFEELENVLFSGDNGTKNTTPRPIFYTTTRRPTILSTLVNSLRPTKATTRKPPTKPSKKPTSSSTATILLTSTTKKPPIKRPSTQYTTKRPTTYITTKKPKPSSSATTKRPRPSATTKKPKPVKRPTTPSEVDEDEETEWSSTQSASSTTASDTIDVDYRTQCGVRPHIRDGRVVGGKGALFGEWPWQVLVRESTWLGLFTKNKCGGVLITQRYVITAAHCQPGFLASLVAVFGEYDISGELEPKRSVSKNVRRVIVHRQYDPGTFENDLALLELESPISYDTHIVPICMPQDNEDFTGRMATVTGWGRLKYGGGVPSVLQEVQVPVIENNVCQEMFQTSGHTKNIISSFLCAGYANGQRDSCEGDSGGPLMLERPDGRWVLVGTVSHGIKCAAPYLPGVYMRTTYYKPWLKSITGVS